MTILKGRLLQECLSKLYYSSKNIESNRYPKRIFSGIQPTGAIHLGNYLGAISQWVKLQDQGEDVMISIADLHSMTLPHDPRQLSRNIQEIAATLLGCGINPEKTILFQQSKVPVHTQLSWCLGCICTMPRLAHLPQYKEKSKDLKDIPLGLFVYPVLQAADILAYKGTHVPVGEDQIQQIQLTQDLARMFNKRFGETFPIPHALVTGTEFAKLRSLRDPAKKMSKSETDSKSRICLTDNITDIQRNIKKAVTDFTSEVTYEPDKRPGISNLINIHSFVANKSVDEICREAKNINTGEYKLIVSNALAEFLKPIQDKITHYLSDTVLLADVLEQGREKANDIATKNWNEVQYKLGLNMDVKLANRIKNI
ncbi:tryptophan--tRNA ligase, mitochondrial [Diorhabda sublineata]|uniref:tryptophan--tRNA ligase, mitochondrial n=1 Tax=Diorhabda sublineata TaxID=1163346 RepID=UPI0024E08A60|nr:tryptophan--tRNA ligase, mitochondrial [Diorhabda sublineata]